MDPTPEMTKRKLLLADDSVTIRKVVELTFAEEGIEVISAANGDEAMQRFVERTPDIVLVDVEMPGMSGYKICEMIKGDDSTKDIPVLLLVGSFEPFDQGEAERVLADGFLTKPFHSIRELVAKVNELLDDVSPMPTPDTADIEHLYVSSFAETMPLHEEITEEDLSQTSYIEEQEPDDLGATEPQPEQPEAADEAGEDVDLGESVLDDEMIETSPVARESFDEHVEEEEGLGEPSEDDEMLDTVHAETGIGNGFEEPVESEVRTEENVDDHPWGSKVDEPVEPAAAAVGVEGSHLRLVEDTAVDAAIHDSSADTVEFLTPYTEPFAAEPPAAIEPAAPTVDLTDETITLIAKRVVEKLSDRVIREIAQEAVPRITEKLIREALEEDGKT